MIYSNNEKRRAPFRQSALRCRQGSSAVEFALVSPLLLAFICGTFQYGILMFSYNMMQSAARDATRQMSTGTATEDQAKTMAKGNLPTWVGADSWTIDTKDIGSTGTNLVQTSITVASTAVSILNFVPMPQTVTVKVIMQKEA